MSQPQDEPAFPRGGRPAVPALERKRLREEGQAQARQDFLSSDQGKRKKANKNEVFPYEHTSLLAWLLSLPVPTPHVIPFIDLEHGIFPWSWCTPPSTCL